MRDRLKLISQMVDSSIRKPQETPEGKKYMLRDLVTREVVWNAPQHGTAYEDACVSRVFWWVKKNVQYRQDPVDYDYYMAAGRVINSGGSDCFTLDTKVVVRSKATRCYELRTLGELRSTWPAYDALSYDFSKAAWVFSPITNWQSRGTKPVCESHLGNGPSFRHTEDHNVWWYDGSGPDSKRRVEMRALGSAIDDPRGYFRRVLVAKKIPALNALEMPQAQAYLAGIYAAEGYSDSKGRVSIAQDRLDIREKIERALVDVGADFSKSARDVHSYYNVKQGVTKDWLKSLGSNSFNMRLPSEMFGCSEQVIREVMNAHADGDAYIPKEGSTWANKVHAIHATSSKALVDELQLSALILGIPWHTQTQVRHGGVGTRPIYRFHRWLESTQAARRDVQELDGVGYSNIKAILPAGEDEVADITVEGTHNFVLSNGMIAHNCDDHTILNAAMLSSIGFRTGARVVSPDGASWHIYALAGVRTFSRPSAIIPMDTTQTEAFPGWEPPYGMRRYEMQTTFQLGQLGPIVVNRWGGADKHAAPLTSVKQAAGLF